MMILRPLMLIEPRAARLCRTRFTAGRDAPTIWANSVWVGPMYVPPTLSDAVRLAGARAVLTGA